ncbi:L-asparaginase 1 [Drosophila ficusphila]|uniref:L-asparaginase 1 n=1 Tax=Drosophila ficusphila TaxID=30025 RepID=UPI0007E83FC2|nr:L-asparaginase 1 [Drosophila ficusphila]
MPAGKCGCTKYETRVHVIYVGGTIGMIRNESGVLTTVPKMLEKKLRDIPSCHDQTVANKTDEKCLLALPAVSGAPYRVLYDLVEFDPLLESSCMGFSDWQRMAHEVGKKYNSYDGFVILHGTDTLAYSASMLAFMLENLNKPVVVTGAQLPIFEARSDGRDNFLGALLVAGNYNIPEVLVFFGNKLFRGCRTTKLNSDSFHAIDSPNLPPLGRVGVNIEINSRQIFRPCNVKPFSLHCALEKNVALLRIYPGITASVMQAFLKEPIKGVVLQTYGAGNFPVGREDLMDALREAIHRCVIIVNISQCSAGMVTNTSETGNELLKLGVIPGYDLTQEAAFAKLAYVLSKPEWDVPNKKKVMLLSLRGELTTNKVAKINDIDLIEGVARTLHMSTAVEKQQMCSTFYPALVASAVTEGDTHKLSDLKQYGANLCDTNCDGRSALHLACFLGKMNCVCFLVSSGCPVNVHDRFNRTPLHEAIDTDNHEIIKVLLKNGATLNDQPLVQAELLRALTERGKVKRMESFRLAGADLTLADRTGRTALHYACQLGNHEVVDYLLPHYENPYVKDELGMAPIDYAKAANHAHIITLLRFRENELAEQDPCACLN